MNKVAHYLQQHLNGEILSSQDALDFFSTDESILRIAPQLILYPRSENDVRKTARFSWQLADKGRVIPLTVRGMGTDQTGAALGSGMIMVMPAHMHKVIELDPKSGVVTVEAGILLDKLQQVLLTHGRFLPPVSDVNHMATLGGAVANNDSGRASYKYGPIQAFTRNLRVVLANGEVIETGRLSKRELNKKLGLASFEGEIYRQLDKIIEESGDLIQALSARSDHSAAGYDIADVKQKDGSFDLTPLFVGSQGTLGVITEITLETAPYNPTIDFMVIGFADRATAWSSIAEVNKLKDGPASIDFVDMTLLNMLQTINPGVLKPLEGGVPAVLLFIDIDDESVRNRKKIKRKLKKIFESVQAEVVEPDESQIMVWERLRDSASMVLTVSQGKKRALPILDDVQIPIDKITEYFTELEAMMSTSNIEEFAVWGQAGNGLIHVAPLFDIASVGERQKIFKIMDTYYKYICSIGGSISGEYAEGRIRGLYNHDYFNEETVAMFAKIKQVFDPANALNPGVKLNVKLEDLKSMVRDDYRLSHQYNHLPRS